MDWNTAREGDRRDGVGIIEGREDRAMQDVGKLFEMAMELSRDEQIDLAERLWANASGPIDPDIEAAWKEEIARRIERLDQ